MQDTIIHTAALNTRDAAKLLGVSKSHLEKLRIDDPKSSPPYFRIGRCIRYSPKQLLTWAEAQSATQLT